MHPAGRGLDMMLVNAAAYDKIIIGFAGIVGDKGEKQYVIDNAAVDFGKKAARSLPSSTPGAMWPRS